MNHNHSRDSYAEAVWRSYLTRGRLPEGDKLPWYENRSMRALARRLPSDPRCQICYYPFSGLGGKLARTLLHLQSSKMNPRLCNICERFAENHPGGTELELSLLFADIRGSTPLAATMSAYDYSRLIDRFYQVTSNIIYEHGGLVEKLVGDEVVAFFVPAFTSNQNHARAAILTGQAILAATGHGRDRQPWAPLGVGVHTGEAFVGSVGEPGKNIDITVLGDNVNVAARLVGQAQQGEIVISGSALEFSGTGSSGLQFRSLSLKGIDDPVDAWVYHAA